MADPEKEHIRRFLCFVGISQNIIPNTILIEVNTHEGNSFIIVVFIYVLDIEEYECL